MLFRRRGGVSLRFLRSNNNPSTSAVIEWVPRQMATSTISTKTAYKLLRLIQELGPISRHNLWKAIQRTETENPFKSLSHLKSTSLWLRNHQKIAVKAYRPIQAAPNQQGEVVEKTKRPEFVYFDLPENTPAQYVPSQEEKLKAREERKAKIVSLLEDLKQRKDENYEKTLKELNPLLKQFDRLQLRDNILASQPAPAAAAAAATQTPSPSSPRERTTKRK